MLTKYMQAAMRRAKYEIIEDDGTYYGYAPDFPGAWANAPTLEESRDELFEIIDDWIVISIADHDPLPVIDDIELKLAVPVEIS